MKKLLLLAIISLFTFTINAQGLDGFGIKLGLGLTNNSWKVSPPYISLDSKDRSSITIRAFVDVSLIPIIQIEGELGYSGKGANSVLPTTTGSTSNTATFTNKLNYITLAALGKLNFGTTPIIPYIIAGPEWNYLVSKKLDLGTGDISGNFKNSTLSITFGAGVEFKLLVISVLAEYRYSTEVTDSYKSALLSIKNYSHSFLVGVKL